MKSIAALLCVIALMPAAQKKPLPKPPPAKPSIAAFHPVSIDPANPHYFRFRNRTTVLISSGVQTAGVSDAKFLDSLTDSRLNLARLRADEKPAWQMRNGKFDLNAWDESYFERIRNFAAEADKRGIVVQVTLFSVQYGSGRSGFGTWSSNPLNALNNLNKTGAVNWDRYNTLDDSALTAAQDALAKRIVATLNTFENVFYEICNEPQFSGATAKETSAWLDHIAATVRDTETKLGRQHLIGASTANKRTPAGCNALDRRSEAWSLLLNGGGIYSHLGDCPEVRYQLSVLQLFLRQIDLKPMKPDREAVRQWALGASDAFVLSDPNRTYLVYLKAAESKPRESVLLFDLPAGRYQAAWLNPRTGDEDKSDPQEHKGGLFRLVTPEYTEDLALRLTSIHPR